LDYDRAEIRPMASCSIEIAAILVYVIDLVTMLALSAAYNMWPVLPAKWARRRFDHSAIYLLIVGTYTLFLARMKNVLAFSRSRVESLGVFAASFEDMSMTSPAWRELGQVVLVYFAVGAAAVMAQDTQPGRATFAEMIAFARLASVPCQRLTPDADSFHALALRRFIKPPITEEEIAAKEKDIKRLRVRLGPSRWCKRYAGQMEQARILVQVLRRQN
jgi:hypothetical protein